MNEQNNKDCIFPKLVVKMPGEEIDISEAITGTVQIVEIYKNGKFGKVQKYQGDTLFTLPTNKKRVVQYLIKYDKHIYGGLCEGMLEE